MSEQEIPMEGTQTSELTEEEIRALVKRALEEGQEEAKYLLKVSTWSRPGPSFEDRGDFKVLYGKVDEIEIGHEYDYPTTNKYEYIIIPKTKIVIILFTQHDDYDGELVTQQYLYVFAAKQGWKSLRLY